MNDFNQNGASDIQPNASSTNSPHGPQPNNLQQPNNLRVEGSGPDYSQSPGTSTSPMEIDVSAQKLDVSGQETDGNESYDPLSKLVQIEILPELYNLMHSLHTGQTQAKDFDNNAGNIRLQLSNIRQTLQDIDGIEESVEQRQSKIELIEDNIARKRAFLAKLKSNIRSDFGDAHAES